MAIAAGDKFMGWQMQYPQLSIVRLLGAALFVMGGARGAFAGGPPKVMPNLNGLVNVTAYDNLCDSLDVGASVYIGKVTRHQPTSAAGSRIEYGALTFEVAETLRGSPAKQLTLPYARRAGFVKGDFKQIWPDSAINGATACIFVVPKTYDPSALPLQEAASAVFVAEPSDQAFGWVRQILKIDAMSRGKNRGELLAALKHATTQPDDHVVEYAFDVLTGYWVESSPKEVTDVLRESLLEADPAVVKRDYLASIVADRLSRLGAYSSIETCKAVARTLALLIADSKDPDLRANVSYGLATVVTRKTLGPRVKSAKGGPNSQPLPFGATDVLSKDELTRLKAALKKMSADAAVAKWADIDEQWAEGK